MFLHRSFLELALDTIRMIMLFSPRSKCEYESCSKFVLDGALKFRKNGQICTDCCLETKAGFVPWTYIFVTSEASANIVTPRENISPKFSVNNKFVK